MFHWFKKHNSAGLEVPDSTPVSIPVVTKPLTLQEQIARFTSSQELALAAQNNGIDTFEEADDFEVGESDPVSPYEYQKMDEEEPVVQTRMDEIRSGQVRPQDSDRVSKRFQELTRKKDEVKKEIGEAKP